MKQVSKKLMNWASILEPNTQAQAEMTSQMPFIFPHLALMPDAHLGKGATVGSVIPTLGAIIPAAVGVDIGCGMIAIRTQWLEDDLPTDRRAMREAVERVVPLSAGKYNTALTETAFDRVEELATKASSAKFDPTTYASNWPLQLGSLGSGNHFIEVTVDETDRVWLFLHSGSRGVGNKIAQHHIKVAQGLMKKYWIALPDPDLAYLVEGTDEFWAYIRELKWAQHFALLNREEMMDRVIACFEEWTGEAVIEDERINCHHNFTEREKHFGKEVWLSRKGAISAEVGRPGLIPGSMGTASYVVVGKGNRLALNSSPHGAGREYSRSRARKTFTQDDLRAAMKGIEYRDTDAFVDEIPQAYKDIDVVMQDAADLVEVKHTLRQIINVKGDRSHERPVPVQCLRAAPPDSQHGQRVRAEASGGSVSTWEPGDLIRDDNNDLYWRTWDNQGWAFLLRQPGGWVHTPDTTGPPLEPLSLLVRNQRLVIFAVNERKRWITTPRLMWHWLRQGRPRDFPVILKRGTSTVTIREDGTYGLAFKDWSLDFRMTSPGLTSHWAVVVELMRRYECDVILPSGETQRTRVVMSSQEEA